jgi:hypothetical protein
MVAILNQKWPPKHKNPPICAKFGFQHDKIKKWTLNYFFEFQFLFNNKHCLLFLTVMVMIIWQSITNVTQTNNTSTSGMNEE